MTFILSLSLYIYIYMSTYYSMAVRQRHDTSVWCTPTNVTVCMVPLPHPYIVPTSDKHRGTKLKELMVEVQDKVESLVKGGQF